MRNRRLVTLPPYRAMASRTAASCWGCMGCPSVNSMHSLACTMSKVSVLCTGSCRGVAIFSTSGRGARSMAVSSASSASRMAAVWASSQPSTMSSMLAVRSISR